MIEQAMLAAAILLIVSIVATRASNRLGVPARGSDGAHHGLGRRLVSSIVHDDGSAPAAQALGDGAPDAARPPCDQGDTPRERVLSERVLSTEY